MTKLAALHMRLAVLYAIIGMALGNYIGGTHDFTLMPVHAHLNLVGWVSAMLYGLVYMVFRDRPVTGLMKAHAWLVHGSLIVMIGSLSVMFLTGRGEPIVALSSGIALIAMILFAVILFRLTSEK